MATTKDGVEVKPGDRVYHHSYAPPAGVSFEQPDEAVIFGNWRGPVSECYSYPSKHQRLSQSFSPNTRTQ